MYRIQGLNTDAFLHKLVETKESTWKSSRLRNITFFSFSLYVLFWFVLFCSCTFNPLDLLVLFIQHNSTSFLRQSSLAKCIWVAVSIWSTFILFRFSVFNNCTRTRTMNCVSFRFHMLGQVFFWAQGIPSTLFKTTANTGKLSNLLLLWSMLIWKCLEWNEKQIKMNNRQPYKLRAVLSRFTIIHSISRLLRWFERLNKQNTITGTKEWG